MEYTPERKRVAMFSMHSDPLAQLGSQESGGQNIYIKYLTEELEKLGWSIDVFTRWDSQHKKQIAYLNSCCRVIRLKGGATTYIPKQGLFELLPEMYSGFLAFIDFKNPYDLFHGHYWDGGWMGMKAHLQFRKPLIQNFHSLGIIRTETKRKYQKDGGEQEYFAKRLNTENDIIKQSSRIICLSEDEKTTLHKLYGCSLEKISVIPGGINIKHWPLVEQSNTREHLGLQYNDFVILYVGRLEWRKGIGTLLSGVHLARKEIPNLKVLIVGGKILGKQKNKADFKEYQRLQKKVKEEQIEDIVRFAGNIDHKNLYWWYRAANIQIVPSYYEPFGLVTLEGMVNKIPVVASRVGGLANIIKEGENGLLFEPRNSLDLKEKILSVYRSKGLTAKITENAYRNVEKNYSWKQIATQMSALYQSLIQKNNTNEDSTNSSL